MKKSIKVRLAAVVCFLATFLSLKAAVINIAYDGAQITLNWQATNCWLQSSDTLAPDSWANVNNPTVVNGGPNSIPLQPLASSQFFRLVESPNLPPPTELTLAPEEDGVGDTWLALWWDPVPLAVSYNLYYATDPSVTASNYVLLPAGAAVFGITNEFYSVTNLIPSVQYYFLVTAVSTNGESAESQTVSGIFGEFGEVSGTVFALLPDGTNVLVEEMPGATITANNINQPQFSRQTRSDAEGNYVFPNLPAGNYQLCWSAPGFVSGCLPDLVVITNGSLEGEDILLTNNGSSLVIFGHVTLADGSMAAQLDPFLNIQENVFVTAAIPGHRPLRSAAVDSFGNYLMTGMPLLPALAMTASNGIVGLSTNVIVTTNVEEVDFSLPDRPPVIVSLDATYNGTPVSRVPSGTPLHVTVVATNSAGSTSGLHYSWTPGNDAASFISADSPTITWTVANAHGLQTMYVVVSDGYGGYDSAALTISTDLELAFAGEVVDTNGVPIAGASVSVNGQSDITDTNGAYSIIVTNLAANYVLVATLPGYVPFTVVYDDESQNTYCVLVPESPCTPADSTTAFYQEDAAQSVLQIRSNSLVTTAGGPPQQPVCVTLDTIDLCAPGNQMSLNPIGVIDGTNVFLQLLAVADVEAADATGASLMLSNNTAMQLTLAVDTNCIIEETNETPSLWWYDQPAAVWRPVGNASPATTPGGLPAYFIQPHNLGLLAVANDPPLVNFRMRLDKSISVPVDVRIFDPAAKKGGFDRIVTVGIIKPGPNFELRTNQMVQAPGDTALTFQVISPNEAPGYYPPTPNPLNKTVILERSGIKVAANGTVDLSLAEAVPNLKDAGQKASTTFLSFITPETIDSKDLKKVAEVVANYYKQLDANAGGPGAKETFAKWAAANGFTFPQVNPQGNFVIPQPNNDDARTVFFNACDLGFGRSLHMKQRNAHANNGALISNYAFCVYYHGSAEDARITKDPAGFAGTKDLIAIAAIDYVYNKALGKWVMGFYNFAPNGQRVDFTIQDESGQKLLPYACMQCHRGDKGQLKKLEAGDDIKGDLGMRLMPLDVASYTFSDKLKTGEPFPPTGNETHGFLALNQAVYNTGISEATKDLLNGWYGGDITKPKAFNGAYVPDGWKDNPPDIPAGASAAYSALAVSCRSCHVTRNGPVAFQSFKDFSAYTIPLNKYVYKFPSESTKPMPNAARPFSIFWGSHAALLKKLPNATSQPVSLATPLPDNFLKNLPATDQWPVLK